MDTDDKFEKVGLFLYGLGEPMPGCGMADADAIAWVQKVFPNKPYCLVRSWRWMDLQAPESVRQEIENSGARLTVIFADTVVLDSRGRFSPGNWVRSTFLVSYTEGGLFETGNTVYVLMGDGCRKTAELKTVFSIF
jgi:hypothetical protein